MTFNLFKYIYVFHSEAHCKHESFRFIFMISEFSERLNASVRSWEKRPSWPWFLGASGGPTQVLLESQTSQNIIKKDLKHSKTCQKLCIYIYTYIIFFFLQKSRQLRANVSSLWGGGGFYLGSQAFNQVDPGLRAPTSDKERCKTGRENSKTAKPMKLYEMMSWCHDVMMWFSWYFDIFISL